MSTYEIAEQVRCDYNAGRISRREALTALRQALDLSGAGAADVLDAAESPFARYGNGDPAGGAR